MNLNQLNKAELLEVLEKMTGELSLHLADSATNTLERYTNVDTNQMVYIFKVGQMKVNVEGLKHLIKSNPNDLTLVNERTSLAITTTTTILTVETKSKELVEFLKGAVNYNFFNVSEVEWAALEEEVEEFGEGYTMYTMEFEFQQEKVVEGAE